MISAIERGLSLLRDGLRADSGKLTSRKRKTRNRALAIPGFRIDSEF